MPDTKQFLDSISVHSDKARQYLGQHRRRLECLSQIVTREAKKKDIRVLEIAPHFTTQLFRHLLGREATINSLGWHDAQLVPPGTVDEHFEFDLNDSHFPDRWIEPSPHDIVVAAEIFEHLFVVPERAIAFFASFVTEGGVLILQTPNGASLRNRLRLLAGRNPFDCINEARTGHVREYTAREVAACCRQAGLVCESVEHLDYWPEKGILRCFERLVPSFRKGLTVIARRPDKA